MKHYISLLGCLFSSIIATAQNSNPWPVTGNVGIGTTTPEATLHIKNTSGTPSLKLSNDTYSSTLFQSSYVTTLDASANVRVSFGNAAQRSEMLLSGNNGKFQVSTVYGAFMNGFSGFKIGHAEKFGFYTNGTTNYYYAIGSVWTDNNNSGLSFFSKNAGTETETMRLTSIGRLGIGTTAPSSTLHVNGTVRLSGLSADDTKETVLVTDANGNVYTRSAATLGGNSTNAWNLDGSTVGALKKFGTTDNFDLPLITNNVEAMRITSGGNVGIGTATPQAKLAVNGDVFAKKVKVTATGWPAWPDYVFEHGYKLPSLADLEAFIKKNKHLPDVPSAKEVEANGLDLGDNQAILLKKIEELTLYVIEQQKQIDQMKKKLEEPK